MSLRQRVRELERDIAGRLERHDAKSRELEQRWHHELEAARASAGHVDHTRPLPRWGIDYAWHGPIDTRGLRAAGVTFAVRYLGGSASKDATRGELELLSGAGIDVALVFEAAAGRAAQGYDAGAADARAASHQARGLGCPETRPVYLACDFDAAGLGQVGAVLEYVRGAVHAIGWHRVGLYAGYDVIEAAHAENRCKYLWQTLAWSHGQWSRHAQLRQSQIDRRIGALECDLDEAVAADFGQWRAG